MVARLEGDELVSTRDVRWHRSSKVCEVTDHAMHHVFLAVVTASALLISPPVRADEDTASVVSLWLGEARTQGGLGNAIEFRADGTAQYTFGALLDGTYRLDGVSLWITPVGQTGETRPVEQHIDGNTAVRSQSPPADAPPRETLSADERAMLDRMSQPLAMTRVGSATPGALAIVGTWTYAHPAGAAAYETFTPGGKFVLRVPMQVTEGTYQATAARIVLKLPQGDETLVRNGDVLVSGSMEGKHSTFRRAPK